MDSMLDLTEFMVAEKKIDALVPGKVYEFSYQRPGADGSVTVSRTFFCLAPAEKDGWRIAARNDFSEWSDFGGIVTRQSSRKDRPETDMHAMVGKTIRELGARDSKSWVRDNLKDPVIREKFGLPPIKIVKKTPAEKPAKKGKR